jgi:putative peptidoglycan lipid II flippase
LDRSAERGDTPALWPAAPHAGRQGAGDPDPAATVAAGVYQISQLFYTFFASRLGEGALTNLFYADRLNQLPLSIIGTALGTAILPTISRSIERSDEAGAADTQAHAFDLAMLLTLPATLALTVTAFRS